LIINNYCNNNAKIPLNTYTKYDFVINNVLNVIIVHVKMHYFFAGLYLDFSNSAWLSVILINSSNDVDGNRCI
jgi:hypothetical protein